MRTPTVSIVVTTYGRENDLKNLFASIQKSTPLEAYEFIIVSSDSPQTDKIKWIRQQSRIRLIEADVRESWQMRKKSNYYYFNLGIKSAQHEWILIINDDMVFSENWYAEFLKVLNNPANSNAGMFILASHIAEVELGLRVPVVGKTKKQHGDWKELALAEVPLVRRDVFASISFMDEKMDWFGGGLDLALAVEFLTDTDIIVAKNIRITHFISSEHRLGNMGNSFIDFHYLINKWNRWCKQNNCEYIWETSTPPYTLKNRIISRFRQYKKHLVHYVRYFLQRSLS